MTYIKINGEKYPAEISGKLRDTDWDGRASKTITLTMSHAEASALFGEGAVWSIICESTASEPQLDENGEPVIGNGMPVTELKTVEEEFDNSDYCVAGDITDHRDGTVSVKMGKATELETALELMLMSPLGDAACEQAATVQAPFPGSTLGDVTGGESDV